VSVSRYHRSRRGRGLRRTANGRWAHVYSALDLGTNNCRLLVAKPARQGFRIVDAFSRITRLGEGVSRSGRLSEAAMARTIEALKICAAKMRHNKVTRARNVATEACRRAENGTEFLARVEAEIGISLDIIDSDEEARLALDGCTSLLDFEARRALVFDIGGGSTELIWLDLEGRAKPERLAWTSLDCGVVTLAERYGSGRIEPEVYETMLNHVRGLLDPFEREHRLSRALDAGAVQMLGTSGTVTTVAGVHLDLPRYDRSKVDGLWLTTDQINHAAQRLAVMDYDERAAHPCIGRGRADLVVAGCAVLEAIIRTWPADRVRVADRGVREGMLRALVAQADAEAHGGRDAEMRAAATSN
jgi:exopolyphosphatase/guanosine-5'-triphosphate,3'-diphosphate pyrophosphatase